jgi:hypothetical protein
MQYARFYFDVLINERGLKNRETNLCGVDATSDLTTHQIGAGKLELNGKCSRNGGEYKLRGYCKIQEVVILSAIEEQPQSFL